MTHPSSQDATSVSDSTSRSSRSRPSGSRPTTSTPVSTTGPRSVETDSDHEIIQPGGLRHRVDSSTARNDTTDVPPQSDPTELAVRLISETAHDLRSPLTSVSATMELIRDGHFGDVTSMQTDCLHAAIRQCDYIQTLVGEMLHADSVLNGVMPVYRRGIDRRAIAKMVREATSGLLATKRIELLFDGFEQSSVEVYADPVLLCRLLVNLIINAEKAVGEHAVLLVKAVDDAAGGIAKWSVIDSGAGMTAKQLEELSAGRLSRAYESNVDRYSPTATDLVSRGTGLGLLISRQLATLHFSRLTIRSSHGSGTEISFETPLSHPTAVATAYARFRSELFGEPSRPASLSRPSSTAKELSSHDAASHASSWRQLTLGPTGSGPRRLGRVAIGTITITGESSVTDQFDRLLQGQLGRFELAYRTDRRGWVWVFDADHRSIDRRLQGLSQTIQERLPSVNINHDEPTIVPVGQRPLQNRLIDRMTTQALSAAAVTASSFGGHADHDTVRLGTQPIAASEVAASRLDEELRRLTTRMKNQSQRLRAQASMMRPPA